MEMAETEEISQEFQPRPYQIQLYEEAVKQNSIIYLPTGTGKTYIAVLLIKKLSQSVQRPYSEGGKRTIFVVNTVALVIQQSTFLNRHTGLLCKGYSGDMQVDYWTRDQWLKEIEENQVLCMTAQIFLNLLTHSIMSLSQVNLLIFDECHRAVKDHPMRQIMQRFENCPKDQQPRVLAMSASLLNANVKFEKIKSTINELEVTFQAKIITVKSLSFVNDYSTNPKEFVEYYEPAKKLRIFDEINENIENAKNILDNIDLPNKMENPASSDIFKPTSKNVKLKRILQDITDHLTEMGLYGGSKCVLLHLIQFECLKKSSEEQVDIAVLEFLITQLMKIQKLLSLQMGSLNTDEFLFKFSSPKVIKLVQILKNFHNNVKADEKFCCLIFVQRRFTAKVLYQILKRLTLVDKDLKFLKPDFMIGYNNNPYKNARENLVLNKWNKKVLIRFRNGVTNCLVATDVVDEGVDIPSCTLVIRYYAPMDFRAYVQSKGRARHPNSHFIILASDEQDYIERYKNFQTTEQTLQQALHCDTDERLKPTEDEIELNLYKHAIIPYTVTHEKGTSVVTEQTAVSLINRYCSNLLKSKFIMLTPAWVKKDIKTSSTLNFQVHLTLPPISPLRETIVGDAFGSIDVAKRSAALKACIKLHKIGELDDDLLPKKVESCMTSAQYLFPYMENEDDTGNGFPGTNSKKRSHNREYPTPLYASYPKENKELFLHIIEMKPNYSKPINDNRHLVFYDLLSNRNTYGILSTKMMPRIPSFPIYMNVGDLQINIKTNKKMQPLLQADIKLLKVFHTVIFHEILETVKGFMIFDTNNEDNSFLVVPVNEDEQIHWEVVRRYKCIESMEPVKPIEVKNSEYEFALVKANYRASNTYIVTQVCEYVKANSCFPTHDFESYVHYFQSKHDIRIVNEKQPMLEVKPISRKINCIKPRNIKAGLSKRKRANLTEDFEEHLVPELCKRIDFPSVYWLKATNLPSILHRITHLLIAEDLRIKITAEARLNLKILQTESNWEPLKIEEQIAQAFETDKYNVLEDTILMEDEDVDEINLSDEKSALEVDILSQECSLYSWTHDQEPTDLDRCAEKIQVIDVEYYYQFMAGVTDADREKVKEQNLVKNFYKDLLKVPVPPIKLLNISNPYGPSPADIMQSLTAKISDDALNYEREETLGDSFLKFAVSLFLFQSYPEANEGILTHLKGKIVGNLNLYYCGKQKNIAGRMKVEDFSPQCNFIPPAFAADRRVQRVIREVETSADVLHEFFIPLEERLSGQLSNDTLEDIQCKLNDWPSGQERQTGMEQFAGMQIVSDKSVSDCVEALIGTYLLHLGIEGAMSILKWFEILPKSLNVYEFFRSEIYNPKVGDGSVDEHIPWANALENKLGYKFKNRAFLLQAFTHPSYMSNRATGSYQRLEFLGDAALDFLLTAYIYETCGKLNPGELTDLRSALVNNITFACLAVRLGLHTALLAHAPKIFDVVDRFVKFQEERNYEVNDELLWILLEENECNMAEHVDVPKVLGDIFESVIGAVYLDSGKNLLIVWQLIYNIMHKEIDSFSKNVPKQPVRVIYETQGANPKFSKTINIGNNDFIMVTLTINYKGQKKFFHGFGGTKKLAKCAASKQALKYLRYKH